MSFDDLPGDWSDLPLDTPGLGADVADLFVGVADRERGTVALLLTDARGRLAQPCLVDVQPEADPQGLVPLIDRVAEVLRADGGGLVAVRGRDGSVLLTDADRSWHEVVLAACRRGGVRVDGVYLATPAAVRAFPAPLTDAGRVAS